jgi:hypothetical protein
MRPIADAVMQALIVQAAITSAAALRIPAWGHA